MKPTGGGTTVTPIAPPAPLFPGITSGLRGAAGSGLGSTLATGLKDAASGADISKIFAAITDANKQSVELGTANIKESMGASGLRFSTDTQQNIAQFQQQSQKDITSQLAQTGLQAEALKENGLSMLEGLATSFAPTQVVSQKPAGASPFSQIASAGEAAMMLFLMAGA